MASGSTIRRTLGLAAALLWLGGTAQATTFRLTATDVMLWDPSPLFTSATVTGTLTLDDAVLPGDSFGSGSITALTLNYGGIVGTLADIAADIAPGPIQGFGTRSADGRSFSVFDLRFGFQPGVAGCSFFCVGQIIINSPIGPNDPSNFFAIDDFDGTSLSVIDSFNPQFQAVPEPATWAMLVAGFAFAGTALRRRRNALAMEDRLRFASLR